MDEYTIIQRLESHPDRQCLRSCVCHPLIQDLHLTVKAKSQPCRLPIAQKVGVEVKNLTGRTPPTYPVNWKLSTPIPLCRSPSNSCLSYFILSSTPSSWILFVVWLLIRSHLFYFIFYFIFFSLNLRGSQDHPSWRSPTSAILRLPITIYNLTGDVPLVRYFWVHPAVWCLIFFFPLSGWQIASWDSLAGQPP